MKLFIFLFFLSGVANATELPHEFIQVAEKHYVQGNYERAVNYLLAVPGVAQLFPTMTTMRQDERARLFFDLGCCYLATGDSVRADQAFKYAFVLNDRLTKGYFETSDPGTFWWALLRNKEAARRIKTKRLFAAMRSIAIPGWGQFYRGHQKKGYAFLGATMVASGLAGLQYRNFKNTRRQYEQIERRFHLNTSYTNEDGTNYTEWEAQHRKVNSDAKRLNVMFGIITMIWALNLADSAIWGPAPMGLTVQF